MRSLHWLVVLAVLIAVATIEILDFFPKGSAARVALFMVHQIAGLSVLALMVLRLFARWGTQAPPPVSGSVLMQRAVQLTQRALCADGRDARFRRVGTSLGRQADSTVWAEFDAAAGCARRIVRASVWCELGLKTAKV